MIETPEPCQVETRLEEQINSIIDQYNGDKQFSLAILQDTQKTYNYLPRQAIVQIARRLDVSLGEIYRLATFFTAFSLQPKGKYETKVCLGTACHVQGSQRILEQLERDLDIKAGQTSPDGKFSIEGVRCVGACALAPVIMVNENIYGKASSTKISKLLKKLGKDEEK
jgi:NADH:ubiquinone oxidoreductase subunit E